jgi:glutathione S-transferase
VVRTKIDRAIKRFPAMFAMLNDGVAPGFLGSDSFTMADCFLMPILASTSRFPEGKESLEAAPALKAYFDRLSERPSFAETAK